MQPEFTVIAPGRVNLLGEHIDYNDGIVLPAAIDRSVRLTFTRMDVPEIHLVATDLAEQVVFSLESVQNKQDIAGKPLPSWALYPAGIAWAFNLHHLKIEGMSASYTSDIPMGAGLSSSAAVEVGFAVAWQKLGGWPLDRMTLARYCQQAEIEYVGVNSGLMDQFASAHGVENHALVFDTRSQAWYPVPLSSQVAIVIADSGVRRSLASSAYNERHAACQQALALLQKALPTITALRDVSPQELEQHADLLPPIIYKRARHVVDECARVEKAVELLKSGDIPGFGQLMYAGHASLRDYYEVSCNELDRLVELASSLPGCYGARLTGAGFGGCTINLVAEKEAPSFINQLKEGYFAATGREAQVYLCKASQGAHIIA